MQAILTMATGALILFAALHQHAQQLSRRVCKFDQPSLALTGDDSNGCEEIIRMFNYPGNRTILCIDDDDGMLRYQRALFERRGYKVLTAASARQGLQIAAACAVAAVIVDYHMPEMNGHQVATEIKRLKPEVPIVMLSSDDEIPKPALNAVDAFVSKNEAPSRLLPVIARICGEKPSEFQESRIAI
jgi:CheY-like chemotaxis protein